MMTRREAARALLSSAALAAAPRLAMAQDLDREGLARAMKLAPSQLVTFAQTVGYPRD